MVDLPTINQIQALQKKNLHWGKEARLSLRITHASHNSGDLVVHGITQQALITEKFTSNTSGVIGQRTIGIDDFPIHLSVNDQENVYFHGECWVSVELLINDDEAMQLCSGFVYAGKGIAWPATQSDDQMPGHGFITQATSADPAAGAEASLAIGSAQLWRFLYAEATLVTDATVANRTVHLVINGGNSVNINCIANTAQTASLTRQYTFANFGSTPNDADDNDILVQTPADAWIQGDGQIDTKTTNLQAGDNWGKIFAVVEKFVGNG